MAAVKVLRVQPTPSSHQHHHSQELISPSSTYPSSSFSSPSSLSQARLQAHYHHARQLQQQRLQAQLQKEREFTHQRVALWDTINARKISGFASPLQKNLRKYLELHPHCVLYTAYLHEQERLNGGSGAVGERKRKAPTKKTTGVSMSDDDEEKSDNSSDSDSSDSSDASSQSSPSSPSSSSGSGSGSEDAVLSPLPAGGKRKPVSADASEDSGSGSGNDSDGSSESNDSMKTEDDADSHSLPSTHPTPVQPLPTAAPLAPVVLPPVTETAESPLSPTLSPPLTPPPAVSNHKPPPFSLASLPFIPRLYTPDPHLLSSDALLTSPSSPPTTPPQSPALLSTRAEPMSPPSPLSSGAFSASEEEFMEVGERAGEEDALEALDRGHSIQAGPFPLGQMREEASSLTPMVEALAMREAGGAVPSLQLDRTEASVSHSMED